MASAQQLIGLIKSHAEGDADRFFDLAMQLEHRAFMWTHSLQL